MLYLLFTYIPVAEIVDDDSWHYSIVKGHGFDSQEHMNWYVSTCNLSHFGKKKKANT